MEPIADRDLGDEDDNRTHDQGDSDGAAWDWVLYLIETGRIQREYAA